MTRVILNRDNQLNLMFDDHVPYSKTRDEVWDSQCLATFTQSPGGHWLTIVLEETYMPAHGHRGQRRTVAINLDEKHRALLRDLLNHPAQPEVSDTAPLALVYYEVKPGVNTFFRCGFYLTDGQVMQYSREEGSMVELLQAFTDLPEDVRARLRHFADNVDTPTSQWQPATIHTLAQAYMHVTQERRRMKEGKL